MSFCFAILNSSGTNTQQNNRLANGHLIVVPFTGTQSLQVADCIRVSNVIEALAAGSTAATHSAGAAVRNLLTPDNYYYFNSGETATTGQISGGGYNVSSGPVTLKAIGPQ